jgi:hypothetical protein
MHPRYGRRILSRVSLISRVAFYLNRQVPAFGSADIKTWDLYRARLTRTLKSDRMNASENQPLASCLGARASDLTAKVQTCPDKDLLFCKGMRRELSHLVKYYWLPAP